MSEVAAWISAIAAVVSLVAAIWATCKAGKAQKAGQRVQERLAEIEEAREKDREAAKKRAVLSSEVRPDPQLRGLGGYKLRMLNRGCAEARAIQITVNGKPFQAHAEQTVSPQEPKTLGPGAPCEYWLAATIKPPFCVEIAWVDDSGSPGNYKATFSG